MDCPCHAKEAPDGCDPISLLAARRNVSPRRLQAPGPDDACLRRIVDAAGHAPDHGRLQPWRFVLIPEHRRPDLAARFVEALVQREPDCDEDARSKAHDRAFHAPCLLAAILVHDSAAASVPRAEKLVSLGCAIQNMLITAQALHFSSGLASGGAMDSPGMRQLLQLAPHEQAVCFLAFGTAASGKAPRQRPQAAQYFSVL
jgi:nitroreductase